MDMYYIFTKFLGFCEHFLVCTIFYREKKWFFMFSLVLHSIRAVKKQQSIITDIIFYKQLKDNINNMLENVNICVQNKILKMLPYS